jgi:hypothetical protein
LTYPTRVRAADWTTSGLTPLGDRHIVCRGRVLERKMRASTTNAQTAVCETTFGSCCAGFVDVEAKAPLLQP